MDWLAELTDKQRAFVREYLVDRNATQAAIRAGYSHSTAAAIGHENLRKPEIAQALERAESKLAEKAGITAAEVISGLKTIATTGEVENARVAAYKLLGQHIGMFKDRQPGDGPDNPAYTKPIAAVPEKETESYAWQSDTSGNA